MKPAASGWLFMVTLSRYRTSLIVAIIGPRALRSGSPAYFPCSVQAVATRAFGSCGVRRNTNSLSWPTRQVSSMSL